MFDLVLKLLANNLNEKEMVLNLIELLIGFAYSEEHMKFLREWVESGPYVVKEGSKVTIPSNLLSQDNRFSIVAFIYRSRVISLEEKTKLLEAEVERDKNSDRSIRARCRCRASLPDAEVKKEIWEMIVNPPESESLYNMKAYMSGFTSIDQLDLVEKYVLDSFLEEGAVTVAKQDYFYVDAFVNFCGPVYFVRPDVIERIESVAEKVQDRDQMRRKLLELADDMRRFHKAQALAELKMALLNRWGK